MNLTVLVRKRGAAQSIWKCYTAHFITWELKLRFIKTKDRMFVLVCLQGCEHSRWREVLLDGYKLAGWILATRKPTPFMCLSNSPLLWSICPFSVWCSATFFHLVSQRPTMCHVYLFMSRVGSLCFPVCTKVLTFRVRIIVLFRPQILTDGVPSVAYLSPLHWWETKGSVLGYPGVNRSDIFIDAISISSNVSWALTPGGAHPSVGLTTAEILHIGELPWSRTRSHWVHPGTWPMSSPQKKFVQWCRVSTIPSNGLACQPRQGHRVWRLEPTYERLRR